MLHSYLTEWENELDVSTHTDLHDLCNQGSCSSGVEGEEEEGQQEEEAHSRHTQQEVVPNTCTHHN